MVRNPPSAANAGKEAVIGSPITSGPFAEDYARLGSALLQAQQDKDLRRQGIVSYELAKTCHEDALNEFESGSFEVGFRLLRLAERHCNISITFFIETGDIVDLYSSMGLKGAVQFDGGLSDDGISKLRESIAVLKKQGAETAELELIVLQLLRQRPESWIYLRRALQLTRKGSPNAALRWEVIMAAIGSDLYEWLKERRQRAQAA
jgi:hypothetical protein